MHRYLFAILVSVLFCAASQAHHSYAIYDIDHPIEITGTVTDYRYGHPHPVITLETAADGTGNTWYIEAPSLRHFKQQRLPADITREGDVVTLKGWPSRSGSNSLLLGTITHDAETLVILDRVRQREAREFAAE